MQLLLSCRNITIRGPANKSVHEWPALDFAYVDGAVELCSTCTATLKQLVLRRERKGTGLASRFFVGKPGSRVQLLEVRSVRAACTPAAVQLKAAKTLQRSPLFPSSNVTQQVKLMDVTFKVGHHAKASLPYGQCNKYCWYCWLSSIQCLGCTDTLCIIVTLKVASLLARTG